MKINYPYIKKILQIGIFSLDLFIFLLVLFSTNSSSETYKEYTGASKFFLDIYIISIYALLIFITIYPRFLFFKLKKYLLFIFTDKGKIIISYAISLIYWFAKNKPQFVLGFLLTITSTILLFYEFIFYFTKVESFLSSKGIEFENKGKASFDINQMDQTENIVNSNNITPMSGKSPNNQSEGNNNGSFEGTTEVKNENNIQQNEQNEKKDVDISSGFEDKNKDDVNNAPNVFGF